MAMRLLQQNFRVAVATKPLNAAGQKWDRGTFVVRVTRNPETIHDAVAKLAAELGVEVTAVNTGFQDEGDTGVGSENVLAMQVAADSGGGRRIGRSNVVRLDLVDARPLWRHLHAHDHQRHTRRRA